jgi:hypothetical protein
MDSDRLWAIFTLKGTYGVQIAAAFCDSDRLWAIFTLKGAFGVSIAGAIDRTNRFSLAARLAIQKRTRWVRSCMARPTGFEPVAPRLGIWCSIRLSYGRIGGEF